MGNTLNPSSISKPTTYERCQKLVVGYIREIDKEIFEDEYILPSSITKICLKYYYPIKIMLWLNDLNHQTFTGSQDNFINISDINNSNKYWKCHLYNLKSKQIVNQQHLLNMQGNAVCFANNVNHCLPNYIHKLILTSYITNSLTSEISSQYSIKKLLSNNPYHILFKSGGFIHNQNENDATDQCDAIIFNDIEFHKSTQHNISAFHWNLPKLPLSIYGNSFIFSDVYGLLSVGGIVDGMYVSSVHNLSFDYIPVMDEWKWNILPPMKYNRYLPSITMISYDKLIVIGGYNRLHEFMSTVEMFDFNNKQWNRFKDIRYKRNQSGILYDNKLNKLYVGGGRCDLYTARKEFEVLDLYSNTWLYDIPDTNYNHNTYPQIFKDTINPQILCISSLHHNCFEYIDLRLHNKSWNILYGNTIDCGLNTQFGVDINYSAYSRLCA